MSGLRAVSVAIACGVAVAACNRRTPDPAPPTAKVSITEGKGVITATGVVTAQATVEAIDQRSRMVTLRRSNGERLRFRVSDDVKNLAQVKRGDLVNVRYYESVALRLHRPGEATPGVTVAEEAERAKPGELPAGAVAEVVTVTAKVVGIDRRNQTVTLEVPNKEPIAIKVNDPALLARVKVGDLVEATYREAIAVAVESPTR